MPILDDAWSASKDQPRTAMQHSQCFSCLEEDLSMSATKPAIVEPVLPVTIQPGAVRYAPAVKAGPWLFATGHKGVDRFDGPISDAVLQRGLPQFDKSKLKREAERIFANLGAVFEAAGSSLDALVRVDQNYTTPKAVEPYHDTRRETLKDHIPPSTSTLTKRLLLTDQEIEVHAVGILPGKGLRAEHIRRNDPQVHATSAYSLGLAAGDLVFVAGRMADSFTFGEGIAPEARLPEQHLWKGEPVKLEAEFIIRKKIEPVLEAAGSSLDHVLKWQVYLRDPEDFASFNDVWAKCFANGGPATTLIPTADPGFFLDNARIEINTIALRKNGKLRRESIDAGGTAAFSGYPQAVRAGDLLFLSGLLPVDRQGLVAAARPNPAMPYYGSSAQEQMRAMLEAAEAICAAAGTTLANVVRIQQYHTDLNDFHTTYQAWDHHLPQRYLPLSAVEVPFLPAPGCRVMLDLWVYVP
jgi:enamine deaminase RidA (YjgF/YER057c/UK114 family)